MNVKVEGHVYKTVVRPALVYGADIEEVGGHRNTNAPMDVQSRKD